MKYFVVEVQKFDTGAISVTEIYVRAGGNKEYLV